MGLLDYNRVIDRINEIEELNVYLPLVLCGFVSADYIDNLEDKEKQKYYKNRVELMGATDYNEYLEQDLHEWLKKHPQFKDIIKING